MPTVSELVEECRRQLHGSHREEFNRLKNAITSSQTTISFDFSLAGITRGSYLSVDDEVMFVWAVDHSGPSCTVQRGMLGTTAAAHDDATIVEVDAVYPRVRIKQALKDEIRSWGPDLFQVATLDVTADDAYLYQGLNAALSSGFYKILEVRHSPRKGETSENFWARMLSYEVFRNAPTGSFASGTGFLIGQAVPEGTVRIVYSKPFDVSTFNDDTDLVATCGLESSMLDIPPLGAAWRLVAPREVQRNEFQAQGEPRLNEEVPASALITVASTFKSLRDMRVAEEAKKLLTKYPWG